MVNNEKGFERRVMTQISNQQQSGELKQAIAGSTWAERWQSLKAGGLGAIAAMLAFVIILQLHRVATTSSITWVDWLFWTADAGILISGAIAAVSGFLFAVTYRYIIRQDQNPHLKSGAVGAFGLVRGLALVQTCWQHTSPLLLAVLVLESFLLFGSVRLVLDRALAQRWVLPFD